MNKRKLNCLYKDVICLKCRNKVRLHNSVSSFYMGYGLYMIQDDPTIYAVDLAEANYRGGTQEEYLKSVCSNNAIDYSRLIEYPKNFVCPKCRAWAVLDDPQQGFLFNQKEEIDVVELT